MPDAQPSLTLIYRANLFVVGPGRPLLHLGRGDDNDIVVASLFASRRHASVQFRDGAFVLTDLSSNGTFLLLERPGGEMQDEIHLRGAEAVLRGRGWIGVGKNATRHGDHSVRFTVQADTA